MGDFTRVIIGAGALKIDNVSAGFLKGDVSFTLGLTRRYLSRVFLFVNREGFPSGRELSLAHRWQRLRRRTLPGYWAECPCRL